METATQFAEEEGRTLSLEEERKIAMTPEGLDKMRDLGRDNREFVDGLDKVVTDYETGESEATGPMENYAIAEQNANDELKEKLGPAYKAARRQAELESIANQRAELSKRPAYVKIAEALHLKAKPEIVSCVDENHVMQSLFDKVIAGEKEIVRMQERDVQQRRKAYDAVQEELLEREEQENLLADQYMEAERRLEALESVISVDKDTLRTLYDEKKEKGYAFEHDAQLAEIEEQVRDQEVMRSRLISAKEKSSNAVNEVHKDYLDAQRNLTLEKGAYNKIRDAHSFKRRRLKALRNLRESTPERRALQDQFKRAYEAMTSEGETMIGVTEKLYCVLLEEVSKEMDQLAEYSGIGSSALDRLQADEERRDKECAQTISEITKRRYGSAA